MTVIDVDSHFEPGPAWLDDVPVPRATASRQFDTAEVTTKIVAGDILGNVPRDEWPSWEELLPPGHRRHRRADEKPDDYGYEGSSMHGAPTPARAGRVARRQRHRPRVGDLPRGDAQRPASSTTAASPREVIHACNSWLADAVDGPHATGCSRSRASTSATSTRRSASSTRMRARGSRAFLIGTIPVPGVPVMHPQFDPIWSAATDLGMIALLHVGYQPASFDPAWANTAGDMMLLRQLGVSQGHQSVELMLNGMVFGGTFDRHPDPHRPDRRVRAPLVRGDARPHGLRDARTQPEARLYMGEYPFDLSPSEFVRRNVRITPAAAAAPVAALGLLETLPGMRRVLVGLQPQRGQRYRRPRTTTSCSPGSTGRASTVPGREHRRVLRADG